MSSANRPILVIGIAVVVMVAVSLYMGGSAKEVVPWREDYAAAKAEAAKEGKPRLLYFTALWCGPCDYMKRTTFASESVKQSLAGYVPVKIDLDRNKELAEQYKVDMIPHFFIVDANGRVTREITGAMSADEFIAWINGK